MNRVVDKLKDHHFVLGVLSVVLGLVMAVTFAGILLLGLLRGLLTENGNRLVYTDTVVAMLGIFIYVVSFARGYRNLVMKEGLPANFVANLPHLSWSAIFTGITLILILLSIVQVVFLMTIEELSLFQQQIWLGITLFVILLLRVGAFWLGSYFMEFNRKAALAVSWWIPLAATAGMWRSIVHDAGAVFSQGMIIGLGVAVVAGLMIVVLIEVSTNEELAKSMVISCVAQIFSTLFTLLMMLLIPLVICFSPPRWGPHAAEDAGFPPSVNAGLALFSRHAIMATSPAWLQTPHDA